MAGLHPTQSGSLFQEDHPEDSLGVVSFSPSSPEVVTSLENRDYVVLASRMRRLVAQLDKVNKLMALIELDSFRQPRCLWGGEIRSYYLAPRQVRFEKACLAEHGVANLTDLLTRCHDLLASRPSDPVLDIALETLRDARLICGQMRRV